MRVDKARGEAIGQLDSERERVLTSLQGPLLKHLNDRFCVHDLIFKLPRILILLMLVVVLDFLNSDNLKSQLLGWVAFIKLSLDCACNVLARYVIASVG